MSKGSIDELISGLDFSPDAMREIAAYVRDLEERLATSTQALEFYANPEIYKPHPHGLAFDQRDVSFCARTALSQIRSQK